MKHYLHLTIILVFTFIQLYGKNVDEAIAKKAATSFITSITGASRLKSGESLELLYKEVVPNALKSSVCNRFLRMALILS